MDIEEIEVLKEGVEVTYFYKGPFKETTAGFVAIPHYKLLSFCEANKSLVIEHEEHNPTSGYSREWSQKISYEDLLNDVLLRDLRELVIKEYILSSIKSFITRNDGPVLGYDTIFNEMEYQYQGSNISKKSIYTYNSTKREKRLQDVISYEYDNKLNPLYGVNYYNVTGQSSPNNIVKETHQIQKTNDYTIIYQYNDKNLPVSGIKTSASQVVNSIEYFYSCN